MFDYKEAFCDVYETYRETYLEIHKKEIDEDLLYKIAYEDAESASRGEYISYEDIKERVKEL